MTPILDHSPWGYWPLSWSGVDSSGNGNDLTVYSGSLGEQDWGYYSPFGAIGTRGDVVWNTGFTPAGDYTLRAVIQRGAMGRLFSNGADAIDTGHARAAFPGGLSSWTWGYTPFDVPIVFYVVVSGGTATYYWCNGNGSTEITSGSAGTPLAGEILLGDFGRHYMYSSVAIFDYALSESQIEDQLGIIPPSTDVEPIGQAIDPFASDGSLFSSVPLYGESWSGIASGGGSEAISAGTFTSTNGELAAGIKMSDGVGPLAVPSALSAQVTIPAGFDGMNVRIGLGWSCLADPETVFGAMLVNDTIGIGTPSWILGSGAVVDVSAGVHTITIKISPTVAELWWDGEYVANSAEPLTHFPYDLLDAWEWDHGSVIVGWGIWGNVTNESFSFGPLSYTLGSGEVGDLEAPDLDGGLVRMAGVDNNLYVGGLESPELDGGLEAPVDPDLLVDVYVGGLEATPLTGGLAYSYSPTTFPPSLPPDTPGYQYGPPSAVITAGPYTVRRTSAGFSAAMNSAGSGHFETYPPGPNEGDQVTIGIGGRAVFTGYAEVSNHEVAPGEENEQTISVSLADILEVDWSETVVWPDIAASDPSRLGRPPQTDRTWDWHSNAGMYDRVDLVSSVGGNNAFYGTTKENNPFPDNWPDPYSKWMWDRNPDQDNIPKGWVYFRAPFGLLAAKEVGIFLCAWDYASLSIDGQQFIEADQPGATFRHDLHLDWDFHLCTIAAYTEGGKAGVNCSIMPKEKHGFTPSVMNSRGGWRVLSYPDEPLRFTVGKVLERLVAEARERGGPAGSWSLAFDKDQDSAGNPWPTKDSLITTATGMTYWDVLNQLAEDRIDFRASPGGRTLYAYVKGKVPRTVSSPWTHGATLSDRYEDRAIR